MGARKNLSNKEVVFGLIVCFSFISIVFSGFQSYLDYDLYLHGRQKAAVVLDSDFSANYRYLIEFEDSNSLNKVYRAELVRRLRFDGPEKTKIQPGDSVMVLNYGRNVKLLYFFESIHQSTDSADIQYSRRHIDEYRRPLTCEPKNEMPVWSPVICLLSLIVFVCTCIWVKRLGKKAKS